MDNNLVDNCEVLLDDNVGDNSEVLVDCNVLNNAQIVESNNSVFNNDTVTLDGSGKVGILSCVVIPPLNFDNEELQKTQHLLISWGLSLATCELLKAYGYNTLTHLEAMEPSDIDEIFLKLDFKFFGERSLLKKRLFEWKDSRVSIKRFTVDLTLYRTLYFKQGINTKYDATVTMSSAATAKVLEWLEQISNEICSSKASTSNITSNATNSEASVTLCPNSDSVTSVLQRTIKGQQVLLHYENVGKLSSTNQKDLTQCLVDFYKSKSRKMTYLEMQQWANAIEERFTNEKSVSKL